MTATALGGVSTIGFHKRFAFAPAVRHSVCAHPGCNANLMRHRHSRPQEANPSSGSAILVDAAMHLEVGTVDSPHRRFRPNRCLVSGQPPTGAPSKAN